MCRRRIKSGVPHGRAKSEKVDAFSAPKSLLDAALLRARAKGWTKSGFYRYCLAKELGLADPEQYLEHGGVKRSLEAADRALGAPAGGGISAGPGLVVGGVLNSPEAAVAVLNDHLAASGTATPATPGPATPGESSYSPSARKGRAGRGRKGRV